MKTRAKVVAAITGGAAFGIALIAHAFGTAFVNVDLGFGPNGTGYVDVDLDPSSPHDYGKAVTTAPDGSLYMLGVGCKQADTSACEDPALFRDYGVYVTHFTQNGVLDTSFGTGGVLPLTSNTSFTGGGVGLAAIMLAVDGNGRYLIGGVNGLPAGPDAHSAAFQVARFNRDGALDITYGPRRTGPTDITGNGFSAVIPTPGDNNDAWVSYMLIGPGEKLYIYGVALGRERPHPVVDQAFLARLDKNGNLDTTFNPSGTPGTPGAVGAVPGYLPFKYGGCDYYDMGTFSFDPSGTHIYLAGNTAPDCFTDHHTTIARVSTVDGTLDPSFGTGGTVSVPSASHFGIHVQEVPASGKVAVLSGLGIPSGLNFRLVQLNHDGSEDTSVPVRDLSWVPSDSHFRFDYPASRYLFQTNGKLVWTGTFNDHAAMTRLAGDPTFSNPVRALPVYDITPDAFSFTPATGVGKNVATVSNSVTIRGVNAAVPVSIDGWSYSINGGPFIGGISAPPATSANAGDAVRVQVTASGTPGETRSATLTIGGVSATFRVTTAKDTTPNAFSFEAVSDAAKNIDVTSNLVTITGTDSPAPVSVTGGTYSVNGGAFTAAAGTANPGDTIQVRLRSSGSPGVTTSVTATVGGVSGTFRVTTRPADTAPDAFSFTPATGATPGASVTSDAVTPTGYDSPAPITVTGGRYRVNGRALTAAAGSIQPGETLQLEATAPAAGQTATVAVNVGGTSTVWTVQSADSSGGSGGGSGGGAFPSSTLLLLAAAGLLRHRRRRTTI